MKHNKLTKALRAGTCALSVLAVASLMGAPLASADTTLKWKAPTQAKLLRILLWPRPLLRWRFALSLQVLATVAAGCVRSAWSWNTASWASSRRLRVSLAS